MNVFLVTKQPLEYKGGKTMETFMVSLTPNLFYRGLAYYFRLLRISRYGVDGWGSREEIDWMEAEYWGATVPGELSLIGIKRAEGKWA